MAKKILLDVLEKTIGKYVKDLDAESLNVAIWSGKIELHGIELNIDAINGELDRQAVDQPNLAIPFRAIGGTFERFEVEVPWTHLMTRPVVLRARGFNVSVEPYDRTSRADFLHAVVGSEQTRVEKIQQARIKSIHVENESRLRYNEIRRITQTDENDNKQQQQNSSPSSSSSFGSLLARRIIENIQIKIENVHLSIKGSESTTGVILGSLSLVTTDSQGIETFVQNSSDPQDLANTFLHKMFKVTAFGIYMDENNKQYGMDTPMDNKRKTKEEKKEGHSYVIPPLSFETRLRQANNIVFIDYAKYDLTSELPSLSINLSKAQLECFRDMTRTIQANTGPQQLFPEYRPLCRVTKETAKDWWHYAVRCIARINGRRLWVEFFVAFQARKKYIPLYKRYAHHQSCSWLEPLTEQEQVEMKGIEQTRTISVKGLMAWRNVSDRQFAREKKKMEERNPPREQQQDQLLEKRGIFSAIFGRKSARKPQDTYLGGDELPITLTSEELKELEDTSNDSDLSKNSKLFNFQFILGSFEVSLTSLDMKQLVLLEMGKIAATMDIHADGSFQFDLKLLSLQIYDKITPKSLFPVVLSRTRSLQPDEKNNEYVFLLTLAKTQSGDMKLAVKLSQFLAIAPPLLFVEVQRYFSICQTLARKDSSRKNPSLEKARSKALICVADATSDQFSDVTSKTNSNVSEIRNKLSEALKKRTQEKVSLSLNIDIDAPQLIIPENCVHTEASILLFDLGHIKFRYGEVDNKKIRSWFHEHPRPQNGSSGMTDGLSLECGELEINHLTFLVETAGNWSEIMANECYSLMRGKMVKNKAIIEPTAISLALGIESKQNDNKATTSEKDGNNCAVNRICAIGEIPLIAINVSTEKVSQGHIVLREWSRLWKELHPPPQPAESLQRLSPTDPSSRSLETGLHSNSPPSSEETAFDDFDNSSMVSMMAFDLVTSRYSIVLVDLESHSNSVNLNTSESMMMDKSMQQQSMTLISQVDERVIIEGESNMKLLCESNERNGAMKHTKFQISNKNMEIYTAFGCDREHPVQILEPAGFSLVLSISDDCKKKKVNIRAAALSPLDFSFSMRDVGLIKAMVSAFSECLKEDKSCERVTKHVPLSNPGTSQMENIVPALQRRENDSILPHSSDKLSLDGLASTPTTSKAGSMGSFCSLFSLSVTMPDTKITFINDLYGLDEALFRITVANFVTGGKISGLEEGGVATQDTLQRSCTLFNFHMSMSFLADYFDSSVHQWKTLLAKPWDVSLKSSRSKSSPRFGASFDIDSFPCHMTLSEQFLESLAATNRMWSIYSMAISSAVTERERRKAQGLQGEFLMAKNAAASTARDLITTLPYAIENHSGVDVQFARPKIRDELQDCANGSIRYFRFQSPRGGGCGEKRLYGQEISRKKTIRIVIKDGGSESAIELDHIDAEIGKPRRAHELENGSFLIYFVIKEGKTIVMHLSSSIEVINQTSIPFAISIMQSCTQDSIGVCRVRNYQGSKGLKGRRSQVPSKGADSISSQNFGVPINSLNSFTNDWKLHEHALISLIVSPQLTNFSSSTQLHGRIQLEPDREALADFNTIRSDDIVCSPAESPADGGSHVNPFVLRATIKMYLVGSKHFSILIFLKPRAKVINKMPVALSFRTLMSYTYKATSRERIEGNESVHTLELDDSVEVFTPGSSIVVSMKCADQQVAGTPIGWVNSLIDLPIIPESELLGPILSVFPFVEDLAESLSAGRKGKGSEFFITESEKSVSELGHYEFEKNANRKAEWESGIESDTRLFCVTACNYAVDHTNTIFFDHLGSSSLFQKSTGTEVYSTFTSPSRTRRITLLPLSSAAPLKLLQVPTAFVKGGRRSALFCLDEIAISKGGIQSSVIRWEDDTPSGYCAYRRLVTDHQSEINIIPEFVVFNGSDLYQLTVRQSGAADITIDQGMIEPIWLVSADSGLFLSMEYTAIGFRTDPVRVDSLGLKVVKTSLGCSRMGSIAIQTVCGAQDSRLVIKVGQINHRSSSVTKEPKHPNVFREDFLRFQLFLSELCVTFTEPRKTNDSKESRRLEFCTVILKQFAVDWQKKIEEEKSELHSPERSHLSILLNSLKITDNTPDTPYPIVFDSAADRINFINLSVRFCRIIDNDLVRVDQFDLNLNQSDGRSENIFLSTNENFVWKVLDLVCRISGSSAELAGDLLVVKWDEKDRAYIMVAGDTFISHRKETKYEAPKSEQLYDINGARVSPFSLVVSFDRSPSEYRYKNYSGEYSAPIMNYLTQRLKFKIEKAELKFPRYEKKELKGPLGQLFEELVVVYSSRMKTKIITILAASSLSDWKSLAGRDDGDDEFVHGDILRITGGLTGTALGYVGKEVGENLTNVTDMIGDGIENATEKVGMGVVGAGVNNVVTAMGSGVGDAVAGVGSGAGKVLKGFGKGVGQIFDGVSGGFQSVEEGIDKCVKEGDAIALVSGVAEGTSTIGTGIGTGLGTAVVGTADGVLNVGKGLFSGVGKVGKGFGGVFTGKTTKKK